MTSAVAVRTPLWPQDREPADLAECTTWIAEQVAIGRRAAIAVACLIAYAHDHYYTDRPAEWLAWARDHFGYGRRFAFRCLKAGRLLIGARTQPVIDALAACDLTKLEHLARLPENLLRPFVDRNDLAVLTRDQVRDKVAAWLGAPGELPEADTAARTPPRRPADDDMPVSARRVVTAVDRLAALDADDQDALAEHVHPLGALRAAIACLGMACESLSSDNFLAADQYGDALRTFDIARQRLAALAADAGYHQEDADHA